MRIAFTAWLLVAVLFCASAAGQDTPLIVYSDLPGAEASDQYTLAVRTSRGNSRWHRAFALVTRCRRGIKGENNYFPHLSDWSNTYINFEMNGPVEIEIAKVNGESIRKAAVHPRRMASSCTVRDGKAYVTIGKPCLIAVDIDGQMDDQDTGKGYEGPPIHTVTIFANPFIDNRPDLNDPTVLSVKPGEEAPSEGAWKTLYFLPGIHDIGVGFPVHANRNYFIRTQDDSTYVNGRGIRRVTYWNDWNGSTFVLSALPNRELIVEDCDVIYARAGWNNWSGGRLFNMRGEGRGACGAGVIFRNIRVEDPRPTLQHFMIAMQGVKPYSDPTRKRGAGNLAGVLFQNIDIAAPSTLGEPDILWGAPDANITDVTFDNVSIGSKKITSLSHFKHNEHVKNIKFKDSGILGSDRDIFLITR